MIKSELYKLFKMKTSLITFVLVVGALIFYMATYGEFGHNLSGLLTIYSNKGLIVYSEENGELVSGQKGYEKNKEVATKYAGDVDDLFLAQLHSDISTSSYIEFESGERFYNATYNFFQDIFNINSENYARRNDVWGEVNGSVRYGFTGDWDAYGNILQSFFVLFSLFIIIFITPLFTYDRECNMAEFLGTVENGGSHLLKYKASAAFGIVNFFMFMILMIISIIHFSQYGFDNADVNIQCSFEQKFISTTFNCTMGQLALWNLLFGIIGCNTVLLLTILISMLCRTTLTAFAMALLATWLPSYPIMKMLGNEYVLNLVLSVMPINAFYINNLLSEVSTWYVLCGIFIIRLVLFVILFVMTVIIWKKNYLALIYRGD